MSSKKPQSAGTVARAKHTTPKTRRWLNHGQVVWHGARAVTIVGFGDLDQVIVSDLKTGHNELVPIGTLSTTEPVEDNVPKAVQKTKTDDYSMNIARSRYKIIKPFLEGSQEKLGARVKAQAKTIGVHYTTIYRWIRAYREHGNIADLAPARKAGAHRASRLDARVEAILNFAITQEYLKLGKSVRHVNFVVRKRCKADGLPVPHRHTVRARIDHLNPISTARARGGYTAALALQAVQGFDPRATHPLALVQIDHTLLRVKVPRQGGKPQRPWATLVIDVYSRMVIGFCLTFVKPSAFSAGLALVNAFLPKDAMLARHGITGSWPCWGLPEILAADNAKEFRGKMLERACNDPRYAIQQDFRPPAKPNYGAHVERLAGTLKGWMMDIVGAIPKTKRSRSQTKLDEFDLFTLEELEGWFTELIVEVYHNAEHSELGMSPLEKYLEGLKGNVEQPGRGVPARLTADLVARLRLDFLPFEERTVQREGISLDTNFYYHPSLRRFVLAKEPGASRKGRKFVLRRDPSDVRVIYFLDPDVDEYIEVPSVKPMALTTLWDLRSSNKAKRKSRGDQASEKVYEGQLKLEQREQRVAERAIADKAAQKTALKAPPSKLQTVQEQVVKLEVAALKAPLRTTPGGLYTNVRIPKVGR